MTLEHVESDIVSLSTNFPIYINTVLEKDFLAKWHTGKTQAYSH